MKNMKKDVQSRFLALREKLGSAGNGGGGRRMPSKKLIVITSMVLLVAIFSSVLMMGILPGGRMTASAGTASLTSVSGKNTIPGEYSPVNVAAGTYTMSADEYKAGTPGSSADGLTAFDFHIFANRFASMAHTCGNIAVNELGAEVLGSTGVPEFGSRKNHDVDATKLSYVKELYGWSAATQIENQVFGSGVDVTGKGQVFVEDANGKKHMMGNDNNGSLLNNIYIENPGEPYIDIQTELDEAEDYMRWLVWMMNEAEDDTDGIINTEDTAGDDVQESVIRIGYNDIVYGGGMGMGMGWFGFGGTTIDFSEYDAKTIIVDLGTYKTPGWFGAPDTTTSEALQLLSGTIKMTGTVGKRIIFNVDTTGMGDSFSFSDTNMTADKLTNSEDSALKDNNILWNFYKMENDVPVSYDGTITVGGTWMGTILAPDATVKCRAGLNGSIIADKVTTTAETHKSDYTGERVTKDKVSLTVTKIWEDNPSMRPEYITLQLHRDGKVISTVQVGANDVVKDSTNPDYKWYYTFKDLPATDAAGTTYQYKVTELKVKGYTTKQVNNIIVNTADNKAAPPAHHKLTVGKTDGENALPGATLRLTGTGVNFSTIKTNHVTGGYTNLSITDKEITWTSTDEPIVIDHLPAGVYTVTEISAPDGYKLADAQNVTLNGPKTVTVVDAPIEVKFNKFNGQSSYNAFLPGADFELTPNWKTSLSGVTVSGATVVSKESGKITFTTGNSAVTFKGIPAGSYTLTEITAPKGYQTAAPTTFVVDANGTVTINGNTASTVDVTNYLVPAQPKFYTLNVSKTGGDKATALAGARLKLTAVDTSANLSGAGVTNAESVVKSGNTITWTSTANAAQITNLPEGSYILSEVSAPAGYKKAADIAITLNEKNTTSLTGSVTMHDDLIKLSIAKLDSVSGAYVAGATLQLTGNNGYSKTITTTGSAYELVGLPAGTYTLEETANPSGYTLNTTAQTFTVDQYGNISGTNVSGVTVTMYNAPTQISITKQYWNDKDTDNNVEEGETGILAGAKLTLSSDKDLSNVTGSITVTHSEDGKSISWTSGSAANVLRGLPNGSYTLTEDEAPAGFETAKAITFTVSGGKVSNLVSSNKGDAFAETSVTLTDKKEIFYPLIVDKIDKDSKASIAGATLAIFKADVEAPFTADKAEVVFQSTGDASNPNKFVLPNGDYILAELEAPEGYNRTEELVYFTINVGGSVNVGDVVGGSGDEPGNDDPGNDDPGNNDTPVTGGQVNFGKPTTFSVDSIFSSAGANNIDGYMYLDITDVLTAENGLPTKVSIPVNLTGDYTFSQIQAGLIRVDSSNNVTQLTTSSAYNYSKENQSTDKKFDAVFSFNLNSTGYQKDGYRYYVPVAFLCSKASNGTFLTSERFAKSGISTATLTFKNGNTAKVENASGASIVLGFENTSGATSTVQTGNFTCGLPTGITAANAFQNGAEGAGFLAYTDITNIISGYDALPNTIDLGVKISGTYKFSEFKANLMRLDTTNNNVVALTYSAAYDNNATSKEHTAKFAFNINNQLGYNESANYKYYIILCAHITPDEGTSRPSESVAFASSGITNATMAVTHADDIVITTPTSTTTTTAAPVVPETPAPSDEPLTKEDIIVEAPTGDKPVVIKLPNVKTPEEQRYLYSIKVTKTNGTSTITSDTAVFNLYTADGEEITVTGENGDYTYSADATATDLVTKNGVLTVDGLEIGTYYLYETKAPSGYILNGDRIEVTVTKANTSDNPAEVEVVNEEQKWSLTINKTDVNGNPLAGAKLTLYVAQVNNGAVDYANAETIGTYETTEGGKIVVSNEVLKQYGSGVYYVVENTAPAGMKLDNTTKWPALTNSTKTSEGNIYFNDSYLYGTALGDNVPAKLLEYTYTDANNNGMRDDNEATTGSAYTNTALTVYDASITVTNEPVNTTFAKVDEDNAPLAGAVLKLEPANGGESSSKIPALGSVYATAMVNGVETRIPVTDNYEFAYDSDGKITGIASENLTWTSRDSAVTLHGLPAGSYTFSEVSAPAGYKLADAQTITVTGTETTFTMIDELKTGEITLTKVDAVYGDRLAGVMFTLSDGTSNVKVSGANGVYEYDANGTETMETAADGTIKVTGLAWGKTYTFTETAAAAGYNKDSVTFSPASAELTSDALNAEIVATNGRLDNGQLTLIKKDADDSSVAIEGAQFKLTYRVAGTGLDFADYMVDGAVWTDTTDKDGKITVTDLPWGYDYKFVETAAATGYDIDSVTYDSEFVTLTAAANTATVNVTNKKLASVTVTKVWKDSNDEAGIRPTAINVQLMNGSTPVGSAVSLPVDGKWTYTWTGLDSVTEDGTEIIYTVKEVGHDARYSSVTTGSMADGYTITNSYAPGYTNVTVEKKWVDFLNQDGTRPASIQVQLMNGDEAYGDVVTLTADDEWTHTWSNLPEIIDGNAADYTVQELDVPDIYTSAVSKNTETGVITITNTLVATAPAETSITVNKIWSDGENRDHTRPATITVQLNANGQPSGDAVTLPVDGEWTYTWTGLAKNAGGKAITYTVTETPVDGYELTTKTEGSVITLTNTYTPETTSITVNKIWEHGTYTGTTPESVTVQLNANGQPSGDPVTLPVDGKWTYTWSGLAKNADGNAINYTVTETAVNGYDTEIEKIGSVVNITNTRKGGQITLTKTDADTNQPISGAQFKLMYRAAGSQDVFADYIVNGSTWTAATDANGVITASALNWGFEYKFVEIGAAPGYDPASITFTTAETVTLTESVLSGDIKATNERITANVIFSKTDVTATEQLPGATIIVTNTDGTSLAEVTATTGAANDQTVTDADTNDSTFTWVSGEVAVMLRNLPAGNYTLTEITAPDGYEIAEVVSFVIDINGKVFTYDENDQLVEAAINKVTMKDAPITVTISKQDINGTSELPGATLVLVPAEGEDIDLSGVTGSLDIELTEDGALTWVSGTAQNTLTKLPAGDYVLTEITAPDGYEVAEDIEFTVDEYGDVFVDGVKQNGDLVVMKDVPTTGTVTISKQDINGTDELPGATLTLIPGAGVDLSDVTGTIGFQTNDDGSIYWVSGENANILTGLPIGSYTLTETTAPDGYEVTESIEFSVDIDGNVVIDGQKQTGDIVVMKDAPITVTISKQDINGTSELPGATLVLAPAEGEDIDLSGVTGSLDIELTEDGELTWVSGTAQNTLTKLPAGDYVLTEITAPDGYEVAEDIEFTVDENGNVYVGGVKQNGDLVVMKDVPTTGTATISKQDINGTDELPGATLTLIPGAGVDLSGVTGTIEFETNEDGSIYWVSGEDANILTGLPIGNYTLTETTAPDGYEVTESIIFSIDLDGDVVIGGQKQTGSIVVMKDAPITVTITKQDINGTDELPGATLVLAPAEGEDIDLSGVTGSLDIELTEDGALTWVSGTTKNELTKLPAGDYVLTEITAPNGYEVAENIEFTVDEEGNVFIGEELQTGDIVVMKDVPVTVTISKKAINGTSELPGATLVLAPAEGEDIDLSGVTGSLDIELTENGALTWVSGTAQNELTKLPAGDYVLTEITAPNGYEVAENIEFTVDEEGNVLIGGEKQDGDIVVMLDEPTTGTVTISKQDINGTDELPGATLTLIPGEGVDLSDVTGSIDFETNEDGSICWVSGEKANVLSKLPIGEYTLTETTAPHGYKVTESIKFSVDEKGDVYIGETKQDGSKVVMKDEPMTATISKQAVGAGSELAGAKLTVKLVEAEAKDVTLENTTGTIKVTYDKNTNSVTWTSADKPNTLSVLPDGVYSLTEVTAPAGYEIAETIYFKVNDGVVYNTTDYKEDKTEWKEVDDATIIMLDELSPADGTASFVKKSDLGKPLAGAVFTLKDSSGKTTNVTSNNNGVVSFTGLDAGQYELTEASAPTGYTKSTQKVIVKVADDGTIGWFTTNGDGIPVSSVEVLFTNTYIIKPGTSTDKPVVGGKIDLSDDLDTALKDLDVNWSSSDNSIAEVDKNGIVTIKKPGNFTITVTHNGKPVQNFVLGATDTTTNTPVNGTTTPSTGSDLVKLGVTVSAVLLGALGAMSAFVYGYKRKKAAGTEK